MGEDATKNRRRIRRFRLPHVLGTSIRWDKDGYALWYKRLEKGSFRFPTAASASETRAVEVKAADLMILDGVDLGSVRRQRRYSRCPSKTPDEWPFRKHSWPYNPGMCEHATPLPDDLALCHEIIRQQADTIGALQRRVEQLEYQVELLLRRQFGPRRESVDPDQLRLFGDEPAEDVAAGTGEGPQESEDARPKRRWRRGGRQKLPEGLPRKRVEYELTDDELPCPDCGSTHAKIGEEVSEQLEYEPSSLSESWVSDPDDGPATAAATGVGGEDGTLAGVPPVAGTAGFVPGRVIAGRYTLLEVLGEGGMGTVYKAEQSQPVRRMVALKLIKVGMDSRTVLARFDAERQALAMMDHPNIARVYDGGATDSGQPFFVMEFVRGVPITEYCDRDRLPVDARLRLFVAACEAVQHAHQKGIIHRDLKPSNVMVTEVDGRPTPKVIDFGVAKATESNLTDQSLGDTGAIVGTPTYMSPEQADPSSMGIDTRTDVYALGVILYELLAGSPPLEASQFRRGAILEMLRMVREVDPARPSTKVSTADALPSIAANRSIDPARLSRLLQGELDWVVIKALEKDRARRYDSANAFARDLRRYLADEVVEARPPSRSYRLRKFVKRNKVQVVAAGLVSLALVAGISGTTWGFFRAEARRKEAVEAQFAEAQRVKERDEALKRESHALRTVAANADELKHRLGVSGMLLAGAALEDGNVVLAAERLGQVPEVQRGWDWRYLSEQARGGLFTMNPAKTQVTWVAYSPDGSKIVSTSGREPDSRHVKTWDARTGAALRELGEIRSAQGVHPNTVRQIAFSPDGKRIATPGENKTARVCDARTGEVRIVLKGHAFPVESVAFSPDGKRIVTATESSLRLFSPSGLVGEDLPGELKVWDAETGAELLDLKGHKGGVAHAAFSPDGTRIVSTGGDFDKPTEVKVWDALKGGKALLELTPPRTGGAPCGSARTAPGSSPALTRTCSRMARS